MRLFIPIFIWLSLLAVISRSYRERTEVLMDFRQAVRDLRSGICERSLSIGQIMTAGPLEQRSLSEYSRIHAHTLALSATSCEKIRVFEREAAFASAEECASLICSLQEAVELDLDAGLKSLDELHTGQVTLATAFTLIVLILLL